MDGTIIRVKGHHVHARDADDWQFLSPQIPKLLHQQHQLGKRIVFFSNQNGLRPRKDNSPSAKLTVFKEKLAKIQQEIGDLPWILLAAIQKDQYRKPRWGMWDYFKSTQPDIEIDLNASFYVGDAAGRQRDHSDADRKFALNVGIPFFTPEQYFFGVQSAQPYTLCGFDPHQYLRSSVKTVSIQPMLPPTLVICVGFPAMGKSTFVAKYFPDFIVVNQVQGIFLSKNNNTNRIH